MTQREVLNPESVRQLMVDCARFNISVSLTRARTMDQFDQIQYLRRKRGSYLKAKNRTMKDQAVAFDVAPAGQPPHLTRDSSQQDSHRTRETTEQLSLANLMNPAPQANSQHHPTQRSPVNPPNPYQVPYEPNPNNPYGANYQPPPVAPRARSNPHPLDIQAMRPAPPRTVHGGHQPQSMPPNTQPDPRHHTGQDRSLRDHDAARTLAELRGSRHLGPPPGDNIPRQTGDKRQHGSTPPSIRSSKSPTPQPGREPSPRHRPAPGSKRGRRA